ncbi:indolepyruvate ferredoxin oxidoreductase subunit alpha [Mycobacterium sp. pR1184]|uniref:indolepyruvate ferredoxin oxidoreductase subunit alpha n=1 Tax=Mycobacterium sp. pR1184 TaxID=3238981 RepID=UPI00351B790B
MPYVIGPTCIEELNGSCVDACPVDCIYEGERRRYIQPDECIECGACLPVCPVDAITSRADAQPEWIEDNAKFFNAVLPGRTEPLGSPGSASSVGTIGVDTELTSTTPAPSKPA